MGHVNPSTFIYAAMAILLVVIAFNTLTISQLEGDFAASIEEIKAGTVPPKIELITINSSCTECSTVLDVIAGLKTLNMEIVGEIELSAGSPEAKALIGEMGIERLPAVVLRGETSELQIGGFRQEKDALVYDSIRAPYEGALSGEIVGKVTAIILVDENCSACVDLALAVEGLRQNGVLIGEERRVDYRTDEGQSLIIQNKVEMVPVLLLSDDIEAYPEIYQNVAQVAFGPENGFYMVESAPPYVDVESGETRGLVTVIYLNDEECNDCYDVMLHQQILTSFGIFLENEETIDISSQRGKVLIREYSVNRVPTVVLKGDVEAYEDFEKFWLEQLGTKEGDGSYVFRELEAMGADIKFRELE